MMKRKRFDRRKKFRLTPAQEYVVLVVVFFLIGFAVNKAEACGYEPPEPVEITITFGN